MVTVLMMGSADVAHAADPYDQSGVPLEVDSKDKSLTKIVLIAGSPSSKPLGHEYFAGSALFMDWLKQTPGVFPVMARDGWPKDERIFENAKAVVFYMDGGDKIPFLDPKRWQIVQKLANGKTGLVFLHQMVDFPDDREDAAMQWLGGDWKSDIGGRGHWESSFTKFPDHPVARGLKPFKISDGWLYNLHFVPGRKNITPILVTVPPDSTRTKPELKKNLGREELIAWTFERANGGRSFAFTAADWHPNWEEESVRRVTINGILWAAGIPIPETGAPVRLEAGALSLNLDRKLKPAGIAAKAGSAKFIAPASLPGIVMDDVAGDIKGSWTGSRSSGPVILGVNYLHDGGRNKGDASITFAPEIPESGEYDIILFAPPHSNRCPDLPVLIEVNGKKLDSVRIDQRKSESDGRHVLGRYQLPAGKSARIIIANDGTTGVVVVDGIQLLRVLK